MSLFDTVTVRRRGTGSRVAVDRACDAATSSPPTARNLVWRAAELLAEHAGVPADAAIEIAKSIPAAAGLAGGSADAAAALVALDALWGTRADPRRPRRAGRPARQRRARSACSAGSRWAPAAGEQLSPVLARRALGLGARHRRRRAVDARRLRASWTGCGPRAACRTASELALGRAGDRRAPRAGRRPRWPPRSANDLQAPALALRPELRPGAARGHRRRRPGGAGERLRADGGGAGRATRTAAVRLAAELAGAGVFRTVRAVHGPVPGARLVG